MSQVAYLNPGKREQTKLTNRQAILDAAREVFGEMGYETATVRDIIRRTALSVGAFYNYYRSKEEVFAALADDGARRFAPILRAQREKAGDDFAAFVRGAIGAYYAFLADEHRNWVADPDEPAVHVHGQTPEMAAVYDEVRAAIVSAIGSGGGVAVDPDYLAGACIAIAREVGEKMLQRRPVDTEGAAAFASAMILSGLAGLPRAGG